MGLVVVVAAIALFAWVTRPPRRRPDPWEPGAPDAWARRRMVHDRDV
jgi:hypothetical protein